jgi:hypothetical protein
LVARSIYRGRERPGIGRVGVKTGKWQAEVFVLEGKGRHDREHLSINRDLSVRYILLSRPLIEMPG